MKIRFFGLLLCIALLFAGCTDTDKKDSKTDPPPPGETTYFFIESTEENSISIELPQSWLTNEQKLLIESFVSEKLTSICGQTFNLSKSDTGLPDAERVYSNYYVDLSVARAYRSDHITSFVFEGMLNQKGAAHPMHLFFALNFNPATNEIIAFTDRYVLDETLYNIFATQAQADLLEQMNGQWPTGWGSFSETLCSKEDFLSGMATGDEFCFYYTAQGIGISYPVPFALGNHIEVELPYTALTPINPEN